MDIKLEFGLRDGKLIHISEIGQTEKGKKCNCTCPKCGKILVAKCGEKRKWHFAHDTVNDCKDATAQETAIHLLAKEIIRENHRIRVPGLKLSKEQVVPKGFDVSAVAKVDIDLGISSCMVNYDSVEIEKTIDDIVADAVIEVPGTICIIEIAVTHFIDEKKRNKLKEIGRAVFEIDLRDLLKMSPTRDDMVKAVLEDETNRYWVFNPKEKQFLAKKQKEFQAKYDNEIRKFERDKKAKIIINNDFKKEHMNFSSLEHSLFRACEYFTKARLKSGCDNCDNYRDFKDNAFYNHFSNCKNEEACNKTVDLYETVTSLRKQEQQLKKEYAQKIYKYFNSKQPNLKRITDERVLIWADAFPKCPDNWTEKDIDSLIGLIEADCGHFELL